MSENAKKLNITNELARERSRAAADRFVWIYCGPVIKG
jgi:hypothetical protein